METETLANEEEKPEIIQEAHETEETEKDENVEVETAPIKRQTRRGARKAQKPVEEGKNLEVLQLRMLRLKMVNKKIFANF